MADHMKLVDGSSNTVSFSPEFGWKPDKNKIVSEDYSMNATYYSYSWGSKLKWIVTIELISKTDRDWLITWWDNKTSLSFYPDLINTPATYYSIYIIGLTSPTEPSPGGGWLGKFRANMVIYQQ